MFIDIAFEKNLIFSILKIVWKRKISIFVFPLIVALFVGVWTKRQPKTYQAIATAIMPLKSAGGSSGFGGLVSGGGMSGLASLFAAGNGGSENLVKSLLNSNRMKKDVAEKFNLKKFYNCHNDELLFKKMSSEIRPIYKQFDDIFVIKVKSIDPLLASKIANFYIENLENLNNELGISVEKKLLQILDKAYPPSYPHGPFTKKNMMTSFIFTLIIMLLFALGYEFVLHNYSSNRS